MQINNDYFYIHNRNNETYQLSVIQDPNKWDEVFTCDLTSDLPNDTHQNQKEAKQD